MRMLVDSERTVRLAGAEKVQLPRPGAALALVLRRSRFTGCGQSTADSRHEDTQSRQITEYINPQNGGGQNISIIICHTKRYRRSCVYSHPAPLELRHGGDRP